MDERQQIQVEASTEQIRENLRQQQEIIPAAAANLPSDAPVAADLTSLHSGYDIYHIRFTSRRKVLGWLVVLAKRVLRQLLTPILERQLDYNAANARMISHLWQRAIALQQISQELAGQIGRVHQELAGQIGRVQQEQAAALQVLQAELAGQIGGVHQEQVAALLALRAELAGQIGRVQAELAGQIGRVHQEQAAALQVLQAQVAEQVGGVHREHTLALQAMRERSSRAERRVRRLLYSLTDGETVEKPSPDQRKTLPRNPEPDFDYFGFEDRYRGSEEDIKERQRGYVEYFTREGLDQVLDIGCGRGEFLELLREAGIKAQGVDLNLDMVLYCQEKGLDVVREDACVYLNSLPDESLGGIFAAQVIEHLQPNQIIDLVKLCQRKLRAGGPLIFETPNPTCLMVFARSFYMDFSHIRPIHPEPMKFLLESAGFQDIRVLFSSPIEASMRVPHLPGAGADAKMAEEFNQGIERLNELLYGFQDYAVIGRKSSQL
jgi:O-antigen chain-terminating methyltransferase